MRIAKWDNVKFVLIYLVVLGHMIASFDVDSGWLTGTHLFIYSFHMPAFLFVSGLFSKNSIRQKRIDKAMVYLVLYVFMKAFRFVVYSLMNGKLSKVSLFEESGVPWFALAVFFYYIITMAIASWKPVYALVFFVGLGIFAGYDSNLGSFLSGMRVLTMYPFFLAGYYLDATALKEKLEGLWVRLVAAAVLIATYAVCILFRDEIRPFLGLMKGKAGYEALDIMPYGGFYRLGYYVIAMLLLLCVISVVPSFDSVFAKWGGRSIQVYALHFPIIIYLVDKLEIEKLCSRLMPEHYTVLVPFLALLLTVILSLAIFAPFFKALQNPVRKNEPNSTQ